ncbi:hypothetical protein [Nostoc sp. C117]|uniref:hypothetical protein n=1 Tax=Nostoc sp. C117 TaxID=3349875 RepID=UPI00370DE20D
MAGLYDLAKIVVDTQEYVFRVTKGFYTGAIATATGVTVTTSDADLALPVIPVESLLRAGVLRTAYITSKLGTKKFRIKVHYTAAKAATVEAALVGATVPTVAGRANSASTIATFDNPLKVTSRS